MVQAFTKKKVIIDSFFKDVGMWQMGSTHACQQLKAHFFFKKTKTILRTHDVQAASVKRQMIALTSSLDPCVEQKIIYLYHLLGIWNTPTP